jgi:pyruvate formate lyase activating enzyme
VVPRKQITIVVDGEYFAVPERTTVKRALELLGLEFGRSPNETKIFAPCETGGCLACAMQIDGKLKPACVTPVRDGMTIDLELPKDYVPLRRVSGFQPHSVGGVGTPWLVKKSGQRYVEVACFAHGCNLRCPQCQNYMVTYDNVAPALTAFEAAAVLTAERNKYGVDRMAISGGEPTLNRAWLIRFFEELRRLNPDEEARLHLDTNATVLTPEFVDGLVEAGVTDVGPDLKGLRTETFMRITGIIDKRLAGRYLENSWSITEYIVDSYFPELLFVGVGIPYNKCFMTLEEIREMGERIADMTPEVQVCLLDYFPSFRRLDMERPSVAEMRKARETLLETGLKTVLAQTTTGHIGP